MNITTPENFRVLVIDDNTEIHKDFSKSLETFTSQQDERLSDLAKQLFDDSTTPKSENPTYEILFASQGQEGLEQVKKALAENKPFALAFVDIRMPPGWDGIQTIHEIWKVDPWIQIVICTAYSDYSWSETIQKTGGTDNLMIIKKPFDIIEVQQLTYALTKKWKLSQEVKMHVNNLENAVKERTQELEKSVNLIRATLESTADGILVVDLNRNIINYNEKFLQMWKIPESIAKTKLEEKYIEYMKLHIRDPEHFLSKIEHLYINKEEESLDEINFIDDQSFERYSKPHIVKGEIIGRVWSYRDITWRKKLQQELLYQATHDKLTNLPNRRLLDDRIRQSIAFSKRKKNEFAILYMDLDNFKTINDGLGHSAGDFVLGLVAKRISSIIREMDTLARLGGDEFAIILSEITNSDQAEVVGKKVLEEIRKPFILNKEEFVITTSIGVSLYPQDGNSTEELLQKADSAMYSAKNSNKNNLKFYHSDMTVETALNLKLENELRRAIINQELELVYQPLIDIVNKKIIGVEALIRWQHPTLGLLSPNIFMPLAEECGLITIIGEWVLRTACKQTKNWQKQDLPFIKMAVNVSSTQFKFPNFDIVLKNILDESGLEPEYLELELTEGVIIENPELMIEILTKINVLGINLVIDDFGTGYSSLSYLRRYPFSKLKIDQVFVRDIEKNENDYKLVQAIVDIGEKLNLQVIAEGVETEQQLAYLKKAKCQQIQGYIVSKPLKANEMKDFFLSYDFNKI